MNILDEIKFSNKKPKELLLYLTNKVKSDHKLLSQFPNIFQTCSSVEKGICMEILEHVSKDKPELVAPYISIVIEQLKDDASRVKWESARVIGNLALKFPVQTERAVDNLLLNAQDKGTVVRWSTAFAITEIAKNNPKLQKKLITQINQILKKEQNNEVKNVYLKALKQINK